MFCPICGVYLTERDLVQRNVKHAMGNVVVEYDARCPHCTEEIGHVSWGQFTVHPNLDTSKYDRIHEDRMAAEKKPIIPPPEERIPQKDEAPVPDVQASSSSAEEKIDFVPPIEEAVADLVKKAQQQGNSELADMKIEPIQYCPHCGQPMPS